MTSFLCSSVGHGPHRKFTLVILPEIEAQIVEVSIIPIIVKRSAEPSRPSVRLAQDSIRYFPRYDSVRLL